MNPLSNRLLFFLSLIFTIVIILSCNESDQTIRSREHKNSTLMQEATSRGNFQLEGKICTLWVRKDNFLTLEKNKPVIFSHVIQTDNHFTLYGWSYDNIKKQEFDLTPNIKLEIGPESSVTFGAGTYLSNIILHKEILKKVKDRIKSDTKIILLVPYTMAGNNLTAYKIMLTSEEYKTAFSPKLITNTGFEANPSPPKNYSEPD